MKILRDDVWKRRGISLLWNAEALSSLTAPQDVISIRQFFIMADDWPAELPSNDGNALVVAGLEGCIDLMSPEEAEKWLKEYLLPTIIGFQDEYGLEAALIFWLPDGNRRIRMNRATETYSWACAAPNSGQTLDLGRILWSGAEADAGHILDPSNKNQDPDGPAWIGLHHPRLS